MRYIISIILNYFIPSLILAGLTLFIVYWIWHGINRLRRRQGGKIK